MNNGNIEFFMNCKWFYCKPCGYDVSQKMLVALSVFIKIVGILTINTLVSDFYRLRYAGGKSNLRTKYILKIALSASQTT